MRCGKLSFPHASGIIRAITPAREDVTGANVEPASDVTAGRMTCS